MIRRLSTAALWEAPPNLVPSFYTPMKDRCVIVGKPYWSYPLAVMPPPEKVAPLITAIRELDSSRRPFRIISHEEGSSGRVFNASFFQDENTMRSFLSWYGENALEKSGKYFGCLEPAAADPADRPTPTSLLFGAASSVLADTRFGEYQLGMAVRYSRQVLRSAEMMEEASVEACRCACVLHICSSLPSFRVSLCADSCARTLFILPRTQRGVRAAHRRAHAIARRQLFWQAGDEERPRDRRACCDGRCGRGGGRRRYLPDGD